ncbi:hypothetical protein, partial [Shewanella indica]|uniref:hypothetical protein n=1 Tax=Shewanella indica TaxID=768528 RepID=UPI001C03D0B0
DIILPKNKDQRLLNKDSSIIVILKGHRQQQTQTTTKFADKTILVIAMLPPKALECAVIPLLTFISQCR